MKQDATRRPPARVSLKTYFERRAARTRLILFILSSCRVVFFLQPRESVFQAAIRLRKGSAMDWSATGRLGSRGYIIGRC